MYFSSKFRIKDRDKWEEFQKDYTDEDIKFYKEPSEDGSDLYSISGTTFIPDYDNFLKVLSKLIHEKSVCTIVNLKHNRNCQGNYYLYGRVDTVTPYTISTIPFEDYTVVTNIKPRLSLLVGGDYED